MNLVNLSFSLSSDLGRSGSFTSALLGGGSGQDPLHFCEIKAGRAVLSLGFLVALLSLGFLSGTALRSRFNLLGLWQL